MQKFSITLICSLFVVVVLLVNGLQAAENPKYTTKYDNIDLDSILTNRRLLKNYVKCTVGKGPCNSEGKELKATLPDALQSDCSKCSEKQREGSEKVIRHLVRKEPELWMELKEEFDKTGQYSKKYEDELKKIV